MIGDPLSAIIVIVGKEKLQAEIDKEDKVDAKVEKEQSAVEPCISWVLNVLVCF